MLIFCSSYCNVAPLRPITFESAQVRCTRYKVFVGGFLQVLRFPPAIKLDICEILLIVAFNTITLTLRCYLFHKCFDVNLVYWIIFSDMLPSFEIIQNCYFVTWCIWYEIVIIRVYSDICLVTERCNTNFNTLRKFGIFKLFLKLSWNICLVNWSTTSWNKFLIY